MKVFQPGTTWIDQKCPFDKDKCDRFDPSCEDSPQHNWGECNNSDGPVTNMSHYREEQKKQRIDQVQQDGRVILIIAGRRSFSMCQVTQKHITP